MYPDEASSSGYPGDSEADSSGGAAADSDADMAPETDSGLGPDDPEMGGSLTLSSEDIEVSRAQQQKRRGRGRGGGRKGEGKTGESGERSAEDGAMNGGFRNGSNDGKADGGGIIGSVGGRTEREGAGTAAGGGVGMRFDNLNDIPDGELIPAAAATIALESCFLGGRRDQAMEIVWQVR